MTTIKHVFSRGGFALLFAVFPMATLAAEITVYKSAKCGCCKEWVEHMRQNGFEVTALDVGTLDEIKRKHAVPGHLAACHTSIAGGYVVEGHVPADAVKRLLSERPKVTGIAVPGMPMGSPGMEGKTPMKSCRLTPRVGPKCTSGAKSERARSLFPAYASGVTRRAGS